MLPIWMTIEPRPTEVRLMATEPGAGPSLKARRLFCSLGTTSIKVPRSYNPYVIARRARRLAEHEHPDFLMLKELVAKYQPHEPTPDLDTSEPPDAMVDGVAP